MSATPPSQTNPPKVFIRPELIQKPQINGNGQQRTIPTAATTMFNLSKIAASPGITVMNSSTHPSPVTITPQINTGNIATAPSSTNTLGAANGPQPVQIVTSNNTAIVRPNVAQPQIVRLPSQATQQQQIIIPRPLHNTISLPPGVSLPPGTILMQNDKGQIVFMQRPNGQPGASNPNMSAQGMIRHLPPHMPRHPASRQAMMTSISSGVPPNSGPVQLKPAPPIGIAVRPGSVQAPRPLLPAASGPDKLRGEEIMKCKNFLETLIRLSSQQPQQTLDNVKSLIQGLLDGSVRPDDFTTQLQKELKSNKQPGLAAFLKKSLPELRLAIQRNDLTIDGLGPKYQPVISSSAPTVVQLPNVSTTSNIRPVGSLATARPPTMAQPRHSAPQTRPFIPKPITTVPMSNMSKQPAQGARGRTGKQHLDLKDDDDLNDVATMGGVNLSEETKNLAVPGDTSQLRSCQDDIFLSQIPLVGKIRSLALKRGVRDVSIDVISLISHACEERLRTLTERCSLAAEHRLDLYKVDNRYEQSSDVRYQIKFLEDLDKLEKKRHEDTEREMLNKAAKSRSKTEDPEQAKLKAKAKELKEAEQEELRQREANITALAAIGPRKKRKYQDMAATASAVNAALGQSSSAASPINNAVFNRPRLKRVNIRDVIFVLEQDRDSNKSRTLYKALLR